MKISIGIIVAVALSVGLWVVKTSYSSESHTTQTDLPSSEVSGVSNESDKPEVLFRKIPSSVSGVDFVHPFEEDHAQAYLYHAGYAVGAICLGDVNGDSLLDIYLVSGPGENRLFLRNAQGSYEAATLPNSGGSVWGTGASLVDLDNDGDLDLYQCNYNAQNQLFLNDGKGVFNELKGAAGLNVVDGSMTPTFADVDNDGDLDLFLLCNRLYRPGGPPLRKPYKIGSDKVPYVIDGFERYYKIFSTVKEGSADKNYNIQLYGRADYFFLNQGTNKQEPMIFKDVSEISGLQQIGHGLSSVWWDYDMDGDLDLYVANDFKDEDRLYRNNGLDSNRVPQFENVIAEILPSTSWSSMGSDVADINHDGLPDLVSLDMAATSHFKAKMNMGELSPIHREIMELGSPTQVMRNHLFTNNSIGMFSESAAASGVSSSDWSWAAKFGDLDNDGWQDLFVSNGVARNFTDADLNSEAITIDPRASRTPWDYYKSNKPMLEKNIAFQSLNGKVFKKRPEWGLGLLGMSYGVAMGDLDNDGDLDLIVSDLGKEVKIYENQSEAGKSYRVKLIGSITNRMGIGAKVIVTDGAGVKRTRWQNPWTGFQGQNDAALHFGLGGSRTAKIEVFWPSGIYQVIKPELNSLEMVITETGGLKWPAQGENKPVFTRTDSPTFIHDDQAYDDFIIQPLLPSKLSQLGPCLAKGDVDGDGDQDFFVGGARLQKSEVHLNEKGIFKLSRQSVFEGQAERAEDSAALWFDADGDKDLDLIVVTGSTEYPAGDALYIDRLLLNTTKDGVFALTPAPEGAFPELKDSGSCVCAADYDGDGDLDLFIGSRSLPGKYPLSPNNRLIRNDTHHGVVKFTDVTPAELKNCGMVTAAEWVDLDQDGTLDLALSIDWGAIAIFRNKRGELINVTEIAGTEERRGWWKSLHAVDIDGDGDLDLVAGNAGINTNYKSPSEAKPALLYYGDMDGSGKDHIVEAKTGKDVNSRDQSLPVRGRG